MEQAGDSILASAEYFPVHARGSGGGTPRFWEAAAFAGGLILMHREILERQFGLRAHLRRLPRSAFRAAGELSRRLSLAA